MTIRSVPNADVLDQLARLIDANEITPVLSRTFPLIEVAKGQEQIATRHTRGKLVIQVAEEPKE